MTLLGIWIDILYPKRPYKDSTKGQIAGIGQYDRQPIENTRDLLCGTQGLSPCGIFEQAKTWKQWARKIFWVQQ